MDLFQFTDKSHNLLVIANDSIEASRELAKFLKARPTLPSMNSWQLVQVLGRISEKVYQGGTV